MTYSRKEIVGPHTLYLGNALKIMPTLELVDLVCTDAPYLVSKGGFASNLQLEGGFGGWMKDYGNHGDIVQCDLKWSDWMPLAFGCLKTDRQAYFMTNGRNVMSCQVAAELVGFELHTLCVWDKRAALPNKYYQNVTEFTLFMRKGKAFTINDPSSKNLFSMFQRDQSEHPTEKPVELMSQYVSNSTRAGDVVLDPFMGSGTTGVAAARLGRRFVGIELEERWFDVACERVSRALDQAHMFAEPLPMPIEVQASMFGDK